MKISSRTAFFSTVVGLLAMSLPMFAHHGTGASYDATKEITLKGTVTSFIWSNPHCQLYFDVKDDAGNVTSWGAENGSPGNLTTQGWNKNIIKTGDEITITMNPSKAGTTRGVTVRIVLPNGQLLGRPIGGRAPGGAAE